MKIMNCDEAFDRLTEASGASDDSLQTHLAECPRCRDMAELLRPALDLIQSPDGDGPGFGILRDDDDHSRHSPANRNASASDESSVFRTTPRPWQAGGRRYAPRADRLRLLTFLLLVGMLTAAIAGISRDQQSQSPQLAITLPPDCQRNEKPSRPADTVIAGCVACHVKSIAGSSPESARITAASPWVQRCVACHLGQDHRGDPVLTATRTCLFQTSIQSDHDLHPETSI